MLEPLAGAFARHVIVAEATFAGDTTVRMFAPGTDGTQTVRFWTYTRDELL